MNLPNSENLKLSPVVAITAQDRTLTGTTQPAVIIGVTSGSTKLTSYVVKPKGKGRMIGAASMREFVASFIASELGLNVPPPALIYVSSDFIESTRFTDNYPLFENSSGNNFGSEYIEGLITISEDIQFFKHFYEHLQKILVFDILISTSDRRQSKPNMAHSNGTIYIYDHELSFSFVHEIFPSQEPWKISIPDRTVIEGHILFNYFKSKEFKCDLFVDSFKKLNEDFWTKLRNILPADIYDDQFIQVKQNLTAKIEKLEIYREEIKKVLL